jgi:hypothetical protein
VVQPEDFPGLAPADGGNDFLKFGAFTVILRFSATIAASDSRECDVTISAEILEFSQTRDPWQQDLLRRIYTQPDLVPDDLAEVTSMIKARVGLVVEEKDAKAPVPLDETHVLHRSPAAPATLLLSIGDVANVNRLAPNQKLPFTTPGITVAFGENGSGKTGLTRIIKGSCRVRRERVEPVLGNVFKEGAKLPAEATIRYQVGAGQPEEHRWTDGVPAPDALSRISVFDAATAPLYADKQSEIEYLPEGLDVLPRLAKACDQLTGRLNEELALLDRTIAAPLPKVPVGTAGAALLGRLVAGTKVKDLPTAEEIRTAGTWDESGDGKALAEVGADLASDPAADAIALRRRGAALEAVGRDCGDAEALLGDGFCQLSGQVVQVPG